MVTLAIIALVAGVAMLAFEAHVPSAGVVGGAGALALVAGVALAVGAAGASTAVALVVAAAFGALLVAALAVAVTRIAPLRRRLPRGGTAGMLGHRGVVRSWSGERGKVLVDGALWHARGEAEALDTGDEVVVDAVHGLTLAIHKCEEWEAVA